MEVEESIDLTIKGRVDGSESHHDLEPHPPSS